MAAALLDFALVLAASPGPRGDNPSDSGGILIVVGIAVAVVLLGATVLILMQRRTRPRRSPDKAP